MCLIANVLVGLFYTPYLVKELGVGHCPKFCVNGNRIQL